MDMNNKLENKLNEETIDLIINAAYGNASMFQKIKVWFLIKENGELKKLYDEYKSTADSVHSLNEEELPEYVMRRIENETKVNLAENENGFFSDISSILFAKPQIIFATTAIVVGLVVSSILFKESAVESTAPYTAAEVELANKQAKEALALVGKILNSTQAALTEEIIPNRVVKPINEGFEYVNELFNKGDI